jgi:hypothetical protein
LRATPDAPTRRRRRSSGALEFRGVASKSD